MHRTCCSWKILTLTLGLLVWALVPAQAQVSKGTFTGTVTDQTGAVIPGATITVTNEGTGVAVTAATSSDGLYTVPDLQPGLYTLKAESKGFKTLVNQHVQLTVAYVQRVDFKLEVGELKEAITVEAQATLVDTATGRMSELITSSQVQNLPLNGRNIYQLIQLAPGAVNTSSVAFDGGGNRGIYAVVNGVRSNMQGYMLDGISDKGLSGGSNTQPSVDSVQEFRVDTEILSAEYGSVVGAVTSIVTKSGGNSLHGDAYEFLRNDKMDAREFFEKPKRNPFRMNQFGATLGGPIKKNKLFFFGSFEGERTRISIPELISIETPQWRNFVIQNFPNSVAALLYKNFPGPAGISGAENLATYVTVESVGALYADDSCNPKLGGGFSADCLSATYGLDPGSPLSKLLLDNRNMPIFGNLAASGQEESRDQFYNGNQFSGRIDYQGDKNKIFGRYYFDRYRDPFFGAGVNGGETSAFVVARGSGFSSPFTADYPQVSVGWSHTFGPTVLNELRAGWSRGATDVAQNNPGVPQITFDTGEVDFGGYNGYPQIFHEEVFHFADIVTWSRGRHTIKFGGEVHRNYENSEFNVGRPSYEFGDSIAFSLGQVESQANGVDPGPVDPKTGQSLGKAHLASNIRGWRNVEFGAFFNDDWKVTPRLTLTLGMRYDINSRHSEKYGHVTQFVLPPGGANLTERLRAVNCYEDISGATGFDGKPCNGGFAQNPSTLTTGDHNNFGPRIGFAWDVFGNGKTSLRGGFGVSYQGEIYNPLSNSRWNPPFYSFNLAFCGDNFNVFQWNLVGPQFTDSCVFGPVNNVAPTFTGPPSNVGTGPAGATFNAFAGNIQGWNPFNANAAFLTGIAFPNFRDPYVYGSHLSIEHEFPAHAVLKVSWVGTFGHKLYRAEDINRHFGGRDLKSASGPTFSGPCALFGPYRVNCLFGKLRNWQNSVNSNYNAFQIVLDKRMSHGLELHTNYVWSHSLDERSTWHSGSTTSNGAAEGFSLDQAKPGLDYGNSIFDVRHRFTLSYVWELPWMKAQRGAVGHVLGGWQLNGAITLRSGFHWTPYCSRSSFPGGSRSSCDFNRDGIRNDRPNQPAFGSGLPSTDRAVFEPNHPGLNLTTSQFLACSVSPRPTCGSLWHGAYEPSLGRNTFVGPNFREFDFSLFKNIKVTERVSFQFRAEAFNLFNRTNLKMPSATFGASASKFGLSTGTFFPREIQFALKMYW